MKPGNTIAAISTPYGKSALGVIRVSGENVLKIIDIFFNRNLKPRQATNTFIMDDTGQIIDDVIAIYYESPHSYTGEDMLEIQCHGNPIILDTVLSILCDKFAAHSKPGEFTERAFMNNKIDLTQVEAIADIINATNVNAAKSALLSLQGNFSNKINLLIDDLLGLRAAIEAAINFPEDDSPDATTSFVSNKIKKLLEDISHIISSVDNGIKINQKPIITIVGKPNVGKSSLANILLGEQHSIVSDEPGTTRDAIKHDLVLDKSHISIIDTAGIRSTENKIESAGISMTQKVISGSTHTLYLVDDAIGFNEEDSNIIKNNNIESFWIVSNKIDLSSNKQPSVTQQKHKRIRVSILKNLGIDMLKAELSKLITPNDQSTGTARARHLDHLNNVAEHLYLSKKYNDNHHLELVAEELKIVHSHLVQIKGGDVNEDLLDKIFSEFCIGK
tara:strand:- start:371 stop:1708 length:1338 start_codon:yes stop_codon:yes gene_type:complete